MCACVSNVGGCEVESSVTNVAPFQHYRKFVYVCIWETHGVTNYGKGWRKDVVNLCLEFRCIYFVVYHNTYFRPQPLFVFAFFLFRTAQKGCKEYDYTHVELSISFTSHELMCSPCNDQR